MSLVSSAFRCLLILGFLLPSVLRAETDSAVVFNEVNFHPDAAGVEWIELRNLHGVNVDLSGWKLKNGVDYSFPEGTVIAGHGYLVISGSPGHASLAGTGALGPWTGTLDNAGETLTLVNRNARVMDELTYGNSGDWPVAADGSGVTLARRDQNSADASPANWGPSVEIGGSAGAANYAVAGAQPVLTVLAEIGSTWKYLATGPASAGWKDVAFDDSAWASGPGLLFAGNASTTGGGAGLLGYWPVTEASGTATTTANQVSGGAIGALFNGASVVTDLNRGQVLNFNGAGSYVDAGSATISQMTLMNDFTWSFWSNSAEGGSDNVMLGNRYSTTPGSGWSPLEFIKFTTSQFEFYDLNSQEGIDYDAFSTGVWYHNVVVKSGATLTYYRNGVAAGARTISQGTNNAQGLYFGSDRGSESWIGELDDIAIWNRALGAGEVAQLTSGSATPQTLGGAGALATELPLGQTTYYFRRSFSFNGKPQRTTLTLKHVLDDGAVIYLNGQEIHRANMPAGTPAHGTFAASSVADAELSAGISIPGTALVNGMNVLAVEVHQALASADPDMVFGLSLTATEQAPTLPATSPSAVVFNEIAAATDASFAIELLNAGSSAVDLAGYRILSSSGASYLLPSQTVAAGGLAVVTKAQLGFTPVSGDSLFLMKPSATGVADAQVVKNTIRGRSPQFPGQWLRPSSKTIGTANAFTFNTAIVINEIMSHAHPLTLGAVNDEQWIELYNRSGAAVSVAGWKFDKGISYTFPNGTTIAPNGYLVVAKHSAALKARLTAALAAKVIGDYSSSLSHSGETVRLVDGNSNPVNEVTYHDSGRWPSVVNAGGSSLELRDARADNTVSEAWGASSEAARGNWQTFSWTGTGESLNDDPTEWNEFIFGLLDAGTFYIDDISVKDLTAGGVELIENGTFESGAATGWRCLGTHSRASVVNDPAGSGKVLQIVATGASEHMHNHVETTLKNGGSTYTINAANTYAITFRARWAGGSNQLNSRLYFNRLATTVTLPVANGGGTPGALNSQAVINIGPTYTALSHSPAVPAPGQTATVTVRPSDPDGLAAGTPLRLFFSVDGGTFMNAAMLLQSDGNYTAEIPAQASGTKVQFYVQATDSLGASSFFPAAGPNSRAMIPWDDGQARLTQNGVAPNNIRIVMTTADATTLHNVTNVMSNDRMPCTVIVNESEIFYDCGVKLKGSEHGRDQPTRVSFNVEFPSEHRFFGVHNTIQIDRSGAGNQTSQKEIMIKHAITHAGGIPGSEDDLCRVIAPQSAHTGPAILVKQRYDSDYLNNQYANGSNGRMFKFEYIYHPLTTDTGTAEGLKIPEPDSVVTSVTMRNLGPSKELHRWHWLIQSNSDLDDYSGLMSWLTAFGRTNDAQYYTETNATMDVDEWLRSFAVEVLFGIGDNYGGDGSGHNVIVYQRPSDGRWLFLPHDMDFTFNNGATSSLVPNGDLAKLIGSSGNKRAYFGHLYDLCTTTYNSAYLQTWAQHYSRFLNEDLTAFTQSGGYVDTRSALALNAVNSAIPAVPFGISTPNGTTVSDALATITGSGWVNIREIRVAGNPTLLVITWIGETTWQVQVPISPGSNTINLVASDSQGMQIGTATVNVIGTGPAVPASAANLVISELMYHPPVPTESGYTDAESFEWIEVMNISATQTVSLAGLRFTSGILFDFPSANLGPGARALVVSNQAAFTARYGSGLQILGAYSGQLSNSGETVTLLDAASATLRAFTYGDHAPWPTPPDGFGYSLVLIRPASNPDHNNPVNWRASVAMAGSPGTSDSTVLMGDSMADDDGDGISNLAQYALAGTTRVIMPTGENTDGFLTLTFRRNLAADDVDFVVERSADLVSWSSSAADVVFVGDGHNPDGTGTYLWRSTRPFGQTAREFLRLRLVKP